MNTNLRSTIFLVTAIVGVMVTWYFNIQFMIETGGFSAVGFIGACYVNSASTSISNDLLVAVFTFLFWSYSEAKRLGMKNWWVYVVLTFGIAVAFAFPFFMFMREKAIASIGDVDGSDNPGTRTA